MALRVIQININKEDYSTVDNFIDQLNALDTWKSYDKEAHRFSVSLLVQQESVQDILDKLGSFLNFQDHSRIFVFPVTATLPVPETKNVETEEQPPEKSSELSREELRNSVLEGTKCDNNFIILVILSTIVAALGLLNNNVAVLIGAMVIAPLLWPNLALALGTVLGDRELIINGLKALFRKYSSNPVGILNDVKDIS